jgi:hypothetical protein
MTILTARLNPEYGLPGQCSVAVSLCPSKAPTEPHAADAIMHPIKKSLRQCVFMDRANLLPGFLQL